MRVVGKITILLLAVGAAGSIRAESASLGATAAAAATAISSAMPAVLADIQSSTNVAVANINADLAKYQVTAAANNSYQLASMQQQTSMYQTYMASLVNAANQAAVSTRLGMQLALAEKLSMLTLSMKQMQFDAEYALKKAALSLQERMLGATIAENRAKLDLMAAQAGLSTGVLPSDSGAELEVSRTGIATGNPSASLASTKLLSSIAGEANAFTQQAPSRAESPARSLAEPVAVARAAAPVEGINRPIRSVNAYAASPAVAGVSSSNPTASGQAIAVPFQTNE